MYVISAAGNTAKGPTGSNPEDSLSKIQIHTADTNTPNYIKSLIHLAGKLTQMMTIWPINNV